MNELIAALTAIEAENGINKEEMFQAIETSLLTACKKNFGTSDNIEVHMDRKTGAFKVIAKKTVVESVGKDQDALEISLENARKLDSAYQLGDICQLEVTPKNFSRIAAQNAKQIIVQKIHEAERRSVYSEYKPMEKEIVSGLIQRKEKGNVYINLGKIEAQLSPKEQIVGEAYPLNKRLKIYVKEVRDSARGPYIIGSRTCPEFIKRLFEQEVPEIHDGIVIIKSIAREAGERSKMAVYSRDPMVDPLGACVGPGSIRVSTIVSELSDEKIDIVLWNEDPAKFIQNALSPAEVERVEIDKDGRTATVIVPDHQLSLAIGKEGQNARLSARLTGYKIDIKSESQAENAPEEDLDFDFSFLDDDDEDLTEGYFEEETEESGESEA
ncbi:MAG: transcription termination/antitermination protein NusA [Firmicutes bacterium]|nr:transcription termination/antitermination protein NusA [Bacillota bacterium]